MQPNNIVTLSTGEIKTIAKRRLTGNWKNVALAIFIVNLISTVPLTILENIFDSLVVDVIGSVYSFVISAPLTVGIITYRLKIFRQMETSHGEIFYGFELLPKALGIQTIIFLICFACTLPIIMVLSFLIVFLGFVAETAGAIVILFLLVLVAMIPVCIFFLRYSLSLYILADDPNKGVFQCISESKWYMSGNKVKLFWVYLSFIGWAILAFFAAWLILIPIGFMTLFIGSGSSFLLLEMIGNIVYFVVFIFLGAYIDMSVTSFYELATGRLHPSDAFAPVGGYYPGYGGGNYPGGGYPGGGQPGGSYPGGAYQNNPQGNGSYPPVNNTQYPGGGQSGGNPFGSVNDLGGGLSGNQSPPDFSGSNPFGNSQFGGGQQGLNQQQQNPQQAEPLNPFLGDQQEGFYKPQTKDGGSGGFGSQEPESLGGFRDFDNSQPGQQTQFGDSQNEQQTQFGNSQPGQQNQFGNPQPERQNQFANPQPEPKKQEEGFRSPQDGVESFESPWSVPSSGSQSSSLFEPSAGGQDSSSFGQFGFGSGPVSGGGIGNNRSSSQEPESLGGFGSPAKKDNEPETLGGFGGSADDEEKQ